MKRCKIFKEYTRSERFMSKLKFLFAGKISLRAWRIFSLRVKEIILETFHRYAHKYAAVKRRRSILRRVSIAGWSFVFCAQNGISACRTISASSATRSRRCADRTNTSVSEYRVYSGITYESNLAANSSRFPRNYDLTNGECISLGFHRRN